MRTRIFLAIGLTLGVCFWVAAALPTADALSDRLKPFEPYLGKTFKGEFVGSTPEKPIFDIARWERALNGRAVRSIHSVNDGQYGGETIIMWDPKRESLIAWYFTTAGFHTEGKMTFVGGKWECHEVVTGSKDGITEVKGFSQILPDGRMHTKAQFLKDGKWVNGHEIYYKESPESKVIFR